MEAFADNDVMAKEKKPEYGQSGDSGDHLPRQAKHWKVLVDVWDESKHLFAGKPSWVVTSAGLIALLEMPEEQRLALFGEVSLAHQENDAKALFKRMRANKRAERGN
jgi:hypothetical protein